MKNARVQVLLCAGGSCISSGTESVRTAFERELDVAGLGSEVELITTGCMGMCEIGPIAVIYPEGIFYQKVKAEDVKDIVNEHLLKGRVVDRLFYRHPTSGELVQLIENIDFFKLQKKIALRNCGNINPTKITEYIAADGYAALGKALCEMTPERVVDEVKTSGLRGRGGAGFPTGLKWGFTAVEKSDQKYVVCNADEGDPGAFMDRSILEGDPHSVIEAMAICGYAIGADQGYVYVRAEYPLAIERLQNAINQARDMGLLGENIFSSGFNFDLEIRMGAGAFVCGEETALMHSIEGKRGEPRPKPPFPAQKGLFGKPTVLNNVETFANIPYIISAGGAEFAKLGTEKSKGTKVFALAGDINNSGLVEVPMGIALGSVVYDIGGGIPNDRPFKAVQIGGPSGGCIPKEYLNTPITYESLPELGAIMGSGGLIVMNEDTCMVDLARYFLEFITEESCGKCTPCRVGTRIMLHLVTKICNGQGTMADLDRLEELAPMICQSSLCGLGQTAPNPVLSTLRYFREEYIEHIRDKHCRAGVCGALMWAPCTNACPASVNVPAYMALVGQGRFKEALKVHMLANPFPSVCGRVCPQWCIKKCRRNDLEGPLAVRLVKRFMADQANSYMDLYPPKAAPNGHKVGVIGSGPAGLTAAYYLVLLGYDVTVFEKQDEPGGMLRYAIPDYRLPRGYVDKEIDGLVELGVTIKTGVDIGKTVTIDSLRADGFEAFFIASGSGAEIKPRIDGVDLPGVYTGIDFLEAAAKGEDVPVGKSVLVIGGGDSAIDASRIARRLGAEDVTIMYRRTRSEMPTNPIEIAEAEVEGNKVEFLANIDAIREKDGKLEVDVIKMRLGAFDTSGRRRPEPIPNYQDTRVYDNVIIAIGQRTDADDIVAGATGLKGTSWHGVEADGRTGATSAPDIFAGGDLVSGAATVVDAIQAGQIGARAVDQFIAPDASRSYPWQRLDLPDVPVDQDADIVDQDPVMTPLLSADERAYSVEVERTISADEAMREACRCLRCDYKV
ncbi:MAG: NADH-ubiquinone oxidoreductase-F iron-sulfur binding region domain-containing protein [Lentisphaeria bacterium]|nr:NADH-ubiquinone oxidoreductase-F iron-sulfur binding region domain-containing protein [Lentisphaeria bacterium]